MDLWVTALITIIAGFAVTFLITPRLIERFMKRSITGKDMNKYEKPEVAEMGGISVLFGFSFAAMAAIFIFTYLNSVPVDVTVLLAGFSTVLIVGFIGVVDDLIGWRKGIRQWQHALFPLFAALPLMAVKVGVTEMLIPFVGIISFGIWYSLILVPVGVTGASNAFNMLAGFNGLEAGLGILITFTLMVSAFLYGSIEAVILMAAMLGALIAFLKFNWIPAKIFPGDSLTLMIGSSIASAAIIGNMERIGILLMGLFFVELVFKARHKFQSQNFGIPQKDGTLLANPNGGSLTHWIMRKGKFSEKKLVQTILAIQAIICIAVFLLFYFQLNGIINIPF